MGGHIPGTQDRSGRRR